MRELDSLGCPLDGVNLIEAAAGTGKTHNIQNLVARLILERGIPISEIAIVTFTEAAAAELSERIRFVLNLVRNEQLGLGDAPEPQRERARQILARAAAMQVAEPERLLTAALRDFDDATIATIHGFCAKVLNENAFESGVLFNSRLEKNSSPYLSRVLTDFCRARLYDETMDPALLALNSRAKLNETELLPTVKLLLSCTDLRLCHAGRLETDPEILWAEIRTEIAGLRRIFDPAALHALAGRMNQGYAPEELAALADRIGDRLRRECYDAEFWAALEAAAPATLLGKLSRRKKSEIPIGEALINDSPTLKTIGKISSVLEHDYRIALTLAAARNAAQKLEEWKTRDNFLFFDDLLLKVRSALAGRLLAAMRKKFRAGIIDEFQDTDPVQYEIFQKIFGDAPEPIFFMVGDPRQAIYTFRGGDLHTYLSVARDCRRVYSLSTNFRSSARLIAAVNTLFARHQNPFATAAIGFGAISAPEPPPEGLRDGATGAVDRQPLQIHSVPDENFPQCARRAAVAILEMLQQNWRLPDADRTLRPEDFAVLAYTHKELETVRQELAALHIPAVSAKNGNVFSSPEASALLTVMAAALHASDVNAVGQALTGRLIGKSLRDLARLTDSGAMAEEQERFMKLGEWWQKAGFYRFFTLLLDEFAIRTTLLGQPCGERMLTNLLQLGDLLTATENRERLSSFGLFARFGAWIADVDESDEASEQLLETDRSAVKLMTVHHSKGLQFPVVLLPGLFTWHAAGLIGRGTGHAADGTREYDLDNRPDFTARRVTENLQEQLRLVYVAVTRAKYRCIIFRGVKCIRQKPLADSPLDWLLRMRDAAPEATADAVAALAAAPKVDAIPPELLVLPPDTPDRAMPPYRPEVEPEPLRLAQFHRVIDKNWRLISYSSFFPDRPATAPDAEIDYDEADAPPPVTTPVAAPAIFAIPGGAALGNAWHRILETVDFRAPDAEPTRRFEAPLRQFGLLKNASDDDDELIGISRKMVADVLTAPLTGADGVSFTLGELESTERCSEMEFQFRLTRAFSAAEVTRTVREYIGAKFAVTEFPESPLTVSGGGLSGFVDLIFRHHGRYFIVDWKSNHLNGTPEGFAPDALVATMGANGYFLQYLLYVLALTRYLRLCSGKEFGAAEYAHDFGGVFYLFLRGVTPEAPGRGVFYDRPDYELIARISQIFQSETELC